ncbi:hypothetical protein A3741_05630 [Oleiphilus sp. HI0069]|nr:hypothetical protein A3741_05630 [Oleiphilus sp. HI0069]KZZ72036.1 hypothetical protein A3763_10560 [Oleiphilus sp. HI0128]
MGRLDQQVKVRGYRIELGEIETLMRQHDAIDDCALSVREVRAGDTRLIAYVVWKNSPISLSELREHLRQQLPPYMVPQHLEALGELPRTLNNKLDRKVLQSWNLTQMSAGESRQGPETSTEKWLALCWGEVCGNHDINKYDNFFDIGGHSLLSIQVIHKVQAHFNVELKPRDLLLESLHQLAELIDQTTKTAATESSAAKGLSDETNKTELHSPATQTIHPVFFGDSKLPLYGVIHEPGAGAYRSKAILFSSPIGHEYFRNYRMTQLLATSLAKQGFYCMRFDYHGVGDSTGEFSTQSIEEWQQDLIKAYEELKARAGVEQVVCVASRLGASIATLANTKCQFNELVLWDPILNGSDYLGKLDTLQKQVLTQNWHFSVRRKSSDLKQGEYLGYQYCTKLQKQIDSLRLADQLNSLNDTPCTVISTTEDESLSATGGQHINYQHIDDEGNWYFYKDIDRSISTHNINQFILKSLSQ